MILVTVGTTLPFDALIKTVDSLVEAGKIKDRIVCQIGHGSYVPIHCEYFKFQPSLDDCIEEASLVIGHGGTGTVFSALSAGKPFVAVANPAMANNHQAEFLARLSRIVSIVWTNDLNELSNLIQTASSNKIETIKGQRLVDDLRAFLKPTL